MVEAHGGGLLPVVMHLLALGAFSRRAHQPVRHAPGNVLMRLMVLGAF